MTFALLSFLLALPPPRRGAARRATLGGPRKAQDSPPAGESSTLSKGGERTMDVQIGKVTHYYDKIGVAVIEVVNQPLKVGDTVKISGHDNEFNQPVTSLQVEHKQVKEVAVGETGGMKVDKTVKEGDMLYLVEHK